MLRYVQRSRYVRCSATLLVRGVVHMTDQEEFDRIYISSLEILAELKINRCTLAQAHKRGELGPGIKVLRPDGAPHVIFWKREQVVPVIGAWKLRLNKRPTRSAKQV